MSRNRLLMLEDDAERLARFEAAVRLRFPQLQLVVWRSAVRMLAELEPHLPHAALIALDHDLESEAGEPDPGDGLDVAKWLADRPPTCPVIIHTSNARRGDAMEGELDLAGWRYARVLPFGDDWIEAEWYQVVRRFLKRSRREE